MEGISLVETATLQALISEVQGLREFVATTAADLQNATKPYLSAQEVMQITGFGHNWLNQHKKEIGYSTVGTAIRFKRKDVEEYMESNYFKTNKRRRK